VLVTETLLEAELFGHEREAFTGAAKRRDGRFKAADGGTLLLDEVAEMPLPAQAKLLRVLQDGVVQPLETNASVRVDVRVVSATHRDLRRRIAEGAFREDLYYRLNVVGLHIPPLRERPGDLPLLANHFKRPGVRSRHPARRGAREGRTALVVAHLGGLVARPDLVAEPRGEHRRGQEEQRDCAKGQEQARAGIGVHGGEGGARSRRVTRLPARARSGAAFLATMRAPGHGRRFAWAAGRGGSSHARRSGCG
jgi:hypothetical protein